MKIRNLSVMLLVALSGLLAACGSATEVAEEPAEAEQVAQVEGPEPGMTAFWEMYEVGYQWAPDLQPLSLRSGTVDDAADDVTDAVAPLWTAIFVSPSTMQAREFTYHAVSQGTARKGVSPGPVQAWGGPTAKGEPFQTGQVAIDSEAALAKATPVVAKWLANNPGEPVSFYLGKESRFPNPVWAVLWGPEGTGSLVIVDAMTGEVIP